MPVTVNSMRDEVADLIGGSGDDTASAKAITLLNRAVNHLNMNGVVLLKRTEQNWTSANGDFASGAQSITLPGDFGWPDDRLFCYDSTGKLIQIAEYRPWEMFRGYTNNLGSTGFGAPEIISIKSSTHDGKLYFWPFIDTGRVAQIIYPYFSKVSQVVAGQTFGENLELGEALVSYAQYLVMQYRYKDKPAIWMPWKSIADEAMRRAKASATRDELGTGAWHIQATPDETGRIAYPYDFFPRGAVYIVLGGN